MSESGNRRSLTDIKWPAPFETCQHRPDDKSLVIAWKPLINGWDIVLGREVISLPDQYTHWLPMLPSPTEIAGRQS